MREPTLDPTVDEAPPAPLRPRKVTTTTVDERLELIGAGLGSLCLVSIAYAHVLPTSGVLGFVVCWFLAFLLLHALIAKTSSPWPIVKDKIATSVMWGLAGIVLFALATTLVYTFSQGISALRHANFFTHNMAGVASTAPLTQGGIVNAIAGTVIMVAVAVLIALPLGLLTAIYLSEVGGKAANVVRTVVEAMTALPEILAALFIYVVLVVGVGFPKSGFAVSVAMSVTMVPIIARTGEVALRIVPSGLREASAALGASEWRTTWKVVVPTARAGLATALILAIARGVGETAVALLLSGASSFTNLNPFKDPMNSLPLYIYTAFETHDKTAIARAFGAASVLLIIILVLFVITRVIAREVKEAR